MWAFDHIENIHTLYHEKDCMKNVCASLTEHMKNLTDFEKKMLPWRKEELKSHQDAKVCYICEKRFINKVANNINYWKVRDLCHHTGKYRVQRIVFVI